MRRNRRGGVIETGRVFLFWGRVRGGAICAIASHPTDAGGHISLLDGIIRQLHGKSSEIEQGRPQVTGNKLKKTQGDGPQYTGNLKPFRPLFPNPDVATIAANFWPRRLDTARFPVEERLFETEPGVRVLIHVQRPSAGSRGECVLVHGLEGSSSSKYMVSMAQALLTAGYSVHRMNIRSCGGTDFLCPTLYHAGLTTDLHAYIQSLGQPVWLIGFSLGGNQVLKLAGELGPPAAELLAGVCGVSTPLDLAACSKSLLEPRNRVYNWHYLRGMKQRLRRRQAALGERWIASRELERIATLWDIDDRVTGPSFGFRDAIEYYSTQSSIRFVGGIGVPCLLVQAKDDPMIPFGLFEGREVRGNANIRVVSTDHGGHIGFLARGEPRVWVDEVVEEWIRG